MTMDDPWLHCHLELRGFMVMFCQGTINSFCNKSRSDSQATLVCVHPHGCGEMTSVIFALC